MNPINSQYYQYRSILEHIEKYKSEYIEAYQSLVGGLVAMNFIFPLILGC